MNETTYYLTFDGGGNKLRCVVYDDRLNVLGAAKSGGVNSNFYTEAEVVSHVKAALSDALGMAGNPPLTGADGIFVGPGQLLARELACKTRFIGEGEGLIRSATLGNTGAVALSGTGATMYYFAGDGHCRSLGRCGAPIGDEGSGYYIGEHGIRAAIQAKNGWGEPTLLAGLLDEYTSGDLFGYFYGKKNPTPLHMKIANFTRAVETAANAGDNAALAIVRDAGECVARQLCALLRRCDAPADASVSLCGGGWKTSPEMEAAFRRTLAPDYPDARVTRPLLEPVAAGAVTRLMNDGTLDEKRESLLANFGTL